MLARLVRSFLAAVPGFVVDRLRTLPVVAPVLRRVLIVTSRSLHGQVVRIAHGPAAGLLLAIDETSVVWASGNTELPVQATLARLVGPGSVLFDVGANVGFFTVLGARLVGASGTVVAFEPHPENVERLRRNIDLNGFSNVVLVPEAASDVSRDRVLDARHPATASLRRSDDAREGGHFVPVDATSLDDFLASRPELTPDVVKIDAEDHEVEIVQGMRKTLARSGPVLICELHRRNRQLLELLKRMGYRTRRLDGAHVLAAPAGHHLVLQHGRRLSKPR